MSEAPAREWRFYLDDMIDAAQKLLAYTQGFDLQLNPASPGLSFHKLDKARDKNFWSVRVGSDIRLIVHRSEASLLLCYVDHHDKAYEWAERRKLETHPKTGAAQLVEIRETVREVVVPVYVQGELPLPASTAKAAAAKPLFLNVPDGAGTGGRQPVRPPRRAAPLSRDGQRRGIAAQIGRAGEALRIAGLPC